MSAPTFTNSGARPVFCRTYLKAHAWGETVRVHSAEEPAAPRVRRVALSCTHPAPQNPQARVEPKMHVCARLFRGVSCRVAC
eukprot:scaffold16900_cov105-Isochrysis_galbana.AAC.9